MLLDTRTKTVTKVQDTLIDEDLAFYAAGPSQMISYGVVASLAADDGGELQFLLYRSSDKSVTSLA